MNNRKKWVALLLSATLCVSMGTAALAAGDTEPDITAPVITTVEVASQDAAPDTTAPDVPSQSIASQGAAVADIAAPVITTIDIAAPADVVMLSPQKLRVNGVSVDCEKYNINDSNYFKLRDLAALLNGTGSQFSVVWNAAENRVEVVAGRAYLPVGGELETVGDYSATAMKSPQVIVVNGAEVSTLSVYNIHDNNFFKLRELGDVLGFGVDFEAETNTVVVTSREAAFWAPVKLSRVFRSEDGTETAEVTEFVLGPDCSIAGEHFTGADYSYELALEYDARGNLKARNYSCGSYWMKHSYLRNEMREPVEETYEYSDGTWKTVEYVYDGSGRLLRQITSGSYDQSEEVLYTYDAAGNPVGESLTNNRGRSNTVRTFDAKGDLLTVSYSDEDGYAYTETYTYDENGNMLSCTRRSADSVTVRTCTYDAENRLLTDDTDDGVRHGRSFAYDAAGRVTMEELREGDTWQRSETEYDSHGNPVKQTDSFSDGVKLVCTYRYVYDAAGRVTSEICCQDDHIRYSREYAYDGNGNLQSVGTQHYEDGKLGNSVEERYEYAPVDDEHQLAEYERTLGYTEYSQRVYVS